MRERVESLPNGANVAYGFANATIALPGIVGHLAPVDSEHESLEDRMRRLTGAVGMDLPMRPVPHMLGQESMMKLTEVDAAFYEGLREILVPAGFKARKSGFSFKQATDFGFQEVIFAILDYKPKFIFLFSIALRFDAIEDVLAQCSGTSPESRSQAVTANVKPEYFTGKNTRFEVYLPEDIVGALRKTKVLFDEYCFPFFDRCNDLARVEHLLNHDENFRLAGNLDARAVSGVVAAALCRRSDFSDIVARYRQELSGFVESTRSRFEATVAHVTANILLS